MLWKPVCIKTAKKRRCTLFCNLGGILGFFIWFTSLRTVLKQEKKLKHPTDHLLDTFHDKNMTRNRFTVFSCFVMSNEIDSSDIRIAKCIQQNIHYQVGSQRDTVSVNWMRWTYSKIKHSFRPLVQSRLFIFYSMSFIGCQTVGCYVTARAPQITVFGLLLFLNC